MTIPQTMSTYAGAPAEALLATRFDFSLDYGGGLWLVRPNTTRAKAWMAARAIPAGTWKDCVLFDHRDIFAVVKAIEADGLSIDGCSL